MSVEARGAQRNRQLLQQRLTEAARVLLDHDLPAGVTLDSLLDTLVESVRADPHGGRLWLLFTAIAGAFPTPEQYASLRRRLALSDAASAGSVVLDATRSAAGRDGDWARPLRIVQSALVIDVNFCAKFVHNTGIQRVVREIMPHFVAEAGGATELVAWTRRSGVMRTLSLVETQRVMEWHRLGAESRYSETSTSDELVVPWKSRVFLPEVPEPALCARLACLAESSGNTVSLIGYDTIPIASADLVAAPESERFAHYLTVVKHADRVVAISESVANEFAGFVGTLEAQGLTGPSIACVPLAADVPASGSAPHEDVPDALPLVLCVGSHEPRKNQEAVLFAAQSLLRTGLEFRILFVGGGSRSRTQPFDRELRRLRAQHGWDIQSARGLKDGELWQLFRQARFTVFASLHEGYGLPVVESLALGTPVLTSNYGSLADIAEGGGCVTVDPRDDQQIQDALQRLLTDDALIASLAAEIVARKTRTWREYAHELRDAVFSGVR